MAATDRYSLWERDHVVKRRITYEIRDNRDGRVVATARVWREAQRILAGLNEDARREAPAATTDTTRSAP